MANGALQNLLPILADLKISIDVWDRRTFQACIDQFHILFCCGIPVHLSRICSIHHNERRCFLKLQLFKVVAKKPRVRIDILFILVIYDDRTAIIDSFYDIRHIADVLLSCLGTEGGLRVCRVLKRCRFR